MNNYYNNNANTAVQSTSDYYQSSSQPQNEIQNSYFDGNFMQLVGWNIVFFLISIATLGFGIPWAMCLKLRWETRHTVIDGKRLYFNGTAAQLFGKLILWYIIAGLILAAPFIIIAIIIWISVSTGGYGYSYSHLYSEALFRMHFLIAVPFCIIIDVIISIFIVPAYVVYIKKWAAKHTTFIKDRGIPYEYGMNGAVYYQQYSQQAYRQYNANQQNSNPQYSTNQQNYGQNDYYNNQQFNAPQGNYAVNQNYSNTDSYNSQNQEAYNIGDNYSQGENYTDSQQ